MLLSLCLLGSPRYHNNLVQIITSAKFHLWTLTVEVNSLLTHCTSYLSVTEELVSIQSKTLLTPGGVLRYISDGDVRSPFLGLKFAI